MKKDWEQKKPHCGETSKYLYTVINKLSKDIELLKTKICLELLLSDEVPQEKEPSKTPFESIEIENTYRPNFPFTIELRYIDLVDLTEKSEGSEVVDISDDSLTSIADINTDPCKCQLLVFRQMNDYGVCSQCPTYDVISCEDIIIQPGMLTSFVVNVKTESDMRDTNGLAVKLLGDFFSCDPVRYLYYGSYAVVTVINNFTGPKPTPLFFNVEETIGKCQILKGTPPILNVPDHEMPISVDYNDLIPNTYNRPIALRINFPFGSIVRVELHRRELESEQQHAVVQMKNILHLSLRSNLVSTYVQIGEVIGNARQIHPRAWIKEKVLGFKDRIRIERIEPNVSSDHNLKRKRGKEKIIKSEPTSIEALNHENSSDMELCSTESESEEECRPKKCLKLEGIETYLSKHVDSDDKAPKIEASGFEIDINQSFLPTNPTFKEKEESKNQQKMCEKLDNDYKQKTNSETVMLQPTTQPSQSKKTSMHNSESKNTPCISKKGQDAKPRNKEIAVDKNDQGGKICTSQSDSDLEKTNTSVPSFEPLSNRFTFNFNVANDKPAEDRVGEHKSQHLIVSFGEELHAKSKNEIKAKNSEQGSKAEKDLKGLKDVDYCNKEKAKQRVIKSILEDLLNNVQEVSMVKIIKTFCLRGEKENLKLFLSQTQNITPKALLEPLNEVVCKSAQFYDISKMLLDHGASVDAQDEDGNTALHYAVQFYPTNKQTVDLLLERGSKTTIKNKLGCTPVVMADDSELKALMKELKQPKNRTKLAIKKIVNKFKVVSTSKRVIIEEEHFPVSSPSILKKRKRSITSESPTKRIKLSDKVEYFQLLD